MKKLLHVGCGRAAKPKGYATYQEVRLDCDPGCEPHVLASVVAMPMVESESVDAVYASHVIEHLFAHEVSMALAELFRVLKPGGEVEILVPDLQGIGGRLALDELDAVLYLSPMGPVTPLDMIFGMRSEVAKGGHSWAHKTGFTASVLKAALVRAGFGSVLVSRDGNRASPELRALAVKVEGPPIGGPSEGDRHAGQERSPAPLLECGQGA